MVKLTAIKNNGVFLNLRDYTEDHTFAICAYGESRYLEQCINSLLGQTIKSRIILFTSTPNDYIAGLAQKYDLPLITGEKSKGIAADWNYAYGHTDTKLVTLAHQDDLYYPGFLEQTLNHINSATNPMMAFTAYHELRGEETVTEKDFVNLRIKRILLKPLLIKRLQNVKWLRRRMLSLGNPICCPSVTYVKDNLSEKIFEEGMETDLDWAAWEKLANRDGSFVYIPRALMAHRVYADSATGELIRSGARKKEDLKMLRKFWPAPIAKLINIFYSKSQNSRMKN